MQSSKGRAARKKITVVGAGNVGATTAQRLAERGWCDVVMIDIVEGLAEGKALDMLEANPILGVDTQIVGTPATTPPPAPTSWSSPPASPGSQA